MRVHFVLLCEGGSDEGLVDHLKALLIDCGVTEVTGIAPDYSRLRENMSKDVPSKIKAALLLEPDADLLFVHRDADSRDPQPRFYEIRRGIEAANCPKAWIGVVPVQETEAWLLLDEQAIRRVSGKPKGIANLNLPSPRQVEEVANPKEILKKAILAASEATGRRRSKLKRKFPSLRVQLLRSLRIDGPLLQVTAWRRLRLDTRNYIVNRQNQM